MMRPLTAAELSDGTLRYLLWIAALLTPRPAELTVLNEPEASLHPDLIPALAGLIARASEGSQIVVVTHSEALVRSLGALQDDGRDESGDGLSLLRLTKDDGHTVIEGQGLLDQPAWHWPGRR
jgi:predicted ATPase